MPNQSSEVADLTIFLIITGILFLIVAYPIIPVVIIAFIIAIARGSKLRKEENNKNGKE